MTARAAESHPRCWDPAEVVSVLDRARARKEIDSTGTRVLLVHMGHRAGIQQRVDPHRLSNVDRICDSNLALNRAFGLNKGAWRQLFGPKVRIRGFVAGMVRVPGVPRPSADARQMPGVFLADRGLIARVYRHRSAADRPCYSSICKKEGR